MESPKCGEGEWAKINYQELVREVHLLYSTTTDVGVG